MQRLQVLITTQGTMRETQALGAIMSVTLHNEELAMCGENGRFSYETHQQLLSRIAEALRTFSPDELRALIAEIEAQLPSDEPPT